MNKLAHDISFLLLKGAEWWEATERLVFVRVFVIHGPALFFQLQCALSHLAMAASGRARASERSRR